MFWHLGLDGKRSEEDERGLLGLNFKFFLTLVLMGEVIRRIRITGINLQALWCLGFD